MWAEGTRTSKAYKLKQILFWWTIYLLYVHYKPILELKNPIKCIDMVIIRLYLYQTQWKSNIVNNNKTNYYFNYYKFGLVHMHIYVWLFYIMYIQYILLINSLSPAWELINPWQIFYLYVILKVQHYFISKPASSLP